MYFSGELLVGGFPLRLEDVAFLLLVDGVLPAPYRHMPSLLELYILLTQHTRARHVHHWFHHPKALKTT